MWNFLGVMLSSGAVAYSIITLLPVDLILHVGSAAGFAMIFALLLAAVDLEPGDLVRRAAQFVEPCADRIDPGRRPRQPADRGGAGGTSGVDWGQAEKVLPALLIAPLIGFVGALLLLLVMKRVLRDPTLYGEPEGNAPPPRGHPRAADRSPAPRSASRMAATTGRRAWG